MVIDSSAVIAILFKEPEADWFEAEFSGDTVLIMSALSLVEISIVLDRPHTERTATRLDVFIQTTRIEVISVSLEEAEVARLAFRQFGRGRHKAALNFGDCFSYALAKVSGERLL